MLKKKLAVGLLSMALATSIIGCGKTEEKPAAAPQEEPKAVEVDKDAIIKEAILDNYFASLSDDANGMIEPQKFWEQYQAAKDSYMLIDVRKPEDFAKGHVDGAVNIPWFKVGEKMAELPQTKQVVFMCYSGQSAGQLVGAFKTAGMNVIAVKGGAGGWEKAGLPYVQ